MGFSIKKIGEKILISSTNTVERRRRSLFNLRWSRTWQLRALKGWTPLAAIDLQNANKKSRRPAPLGKSKCNTASIGRASDVDLRTGWAGHDTTREMLDRHCYGFIPTNHMDNHKGETCLGS